MLTLDKHAPGFYTQQHAELALAFAAQAAIAIANARLYDQSQRELTERKRAEAGLRAANERLNAQLVEIEALHVQLREQAIRDLLTGLHNRRYLKETLEREVARAARAGTMLSVIMMDVDEFKRVNDTFGHKAGDMMLQAIGNLLRTHTRRSDILCRYGGEEFLVVMPEATAQSALQRAEQLRDAIQTLRVSHGGADLHVTLSLGIAAFPIHGQTDEEVLRSADKALYAAKARGRNCVVVFGGATG
jgi:diguanylate cyclase (GGDEF)-like protein